MSIPLKIAIKAFAGNLATSIWYFPWFTKFLHSIRGINFKDRNSVFIGRDVILDNSHPSSIYIESRVHICAKALIIGHSLKLNKSHKREFISKKTYLGHNSFIGAGSIILPGLKLGKNCIIGAGSVVTKDVKDNEIVAGNPAKHIRYI
tara:strand:+ start:1498 stop:1941 length:444 start_codon:yes stop_codon:yes gene_type:complete